MKDQTATDVYVKTLARAAAEGVSLAQLSRSFPPISSPRSSISARRRPLDVQIAGTNLDASRAFANKLLAKIRSVPGVADPRIQEQFQDPALKVDFNRELAGVVGLTESDASTSIQATLSGSTQTAPTYWLNPTNGVSYPVSVQTPQYGIDTLGELKNLPLTAAHPPNCWAVSRPSRPSLCTPSFRTTISAPAVNIYATTQGRDLGSVAADDAENRRRFRARTCPKARPSRFAARPAP